jgi:hypothetical protein
MLLNKTSGPDSYDRRQQAYDTQARQEQSIARCVPSAFSGQAE